jgi:hypothetical protein
VSEGRVFGPFFGGLKKLKELLVFTQNLQNQRKIKESFEELTLNH